MKRTYLGEFEEIILLTVAYLQGQAYGVRIIHEICEQTNRKVRLNQIHVALHRLEEKGMIGSQLGGATPKRGGRRKRLFSITTLGEQTLLDIQAVRSQLWSHLPQLLQIRVLI